MKKQKQHKYPKFYNRGFQAGKMDCIDFGKRRNFDEEYSLEETIAYKELIDTIIEGYNDGYEAAEAFLKSKELPTISVEPPVSQEVQEKRVKDIKKLNRKASKEDYDLDLWRSKTKSYRRF